MMHQNGAQARFLCLFRYFGGGADGTFIARGNAHAPWLRFVKSICLDTDAGLSQAVSGAVEIEGGSVLSPAQRRRAQRRGACRPKGRDARYHSGPAGSGFRPVPCALCLFCASKRLCQNIVSAHRQRGIAGKKALDFGKRNGKLHHAHIARAKGAFGPTAANRQSQAANVPTRTMRRSLERCAAPGQHSDALLSGMRREPGRLFSVPIRRAYGKKPSHRARAPGILRKKERGSMPRPHDSAVYPLRSRSAGMGFLRTLEAKGKESTYNTKPVKMMRPAVV